MDRRGFIVGAAVQAAALAAAPALANVPSAYDWSASLLDKAATLSSNGW